MSYSNVGKVWDIEGFSDYLDSLPAIKWADSVTVHHTGTPDLSQRPKGWTIQHMRNLAHYYGKQLGWSAGPHLFTDEDQIFGLSPLNAPGTHARSFNSRSIGLEMLGNYDIEDPAGDRGKQVLRTSILAVAALLKKLGKEATDKTILFHRNDPKTSKTCPGTKIDKAWFVSEVAKVMADDEPEEKQQAEPIDRFSILDACDSIEWQLKKIRNHLRS